MQYQETPGMINYQVYDRHYPYSPEGNFTITNRYPTKPITIKSKKTRTVFTKSQINELEQMFFSKRYLNTTDRTQLAKKLTLTENQVKVWFQNRRNKWKKDMAMNYVSNMSLPTNQITPLVPFFNNNEIPVNNKQTENFLTANCCNNDVNEKSSRNTKRLQHIDSYLSSIPSTNEDLQLPFLEQFYNFPDNNNNNSSSNIGDSNNNISDNGSLSYVELNNNNFNSDCFYGNSQYLQYTV